MFEYEILRLPNQHSVDDIVALYATLSPGAKAPDLATIDRACRENFVIVARDTSIERGPIVGMATLFVMAKIAGLRGRVEDVVRHPAYKGRGIGRGLMRKLHETAVERGVGKLVLSSRNHRVEAHKLYLAIGYEPYATNVFSFDLTKGVWRED